MSNSSFYSQSGGNEATANSIQTKVNEAEDAKVAAEAAQAAAEAAQGYAETAQTRAETAETNAEASETSASGSATTATTKAAEASTSATNAAASATTATTQASAASTSATNAATSASTASTKATEAATSATTASTEATAAATSASSASTSASTATTKASEASTSATAAAASEADAEDHKDDAQKLAAHAEDSQYTLSDGSTTGYSALHYNEKASDSATAAAASETAAASSATSASTSASTATTKASEASTSASSASTSASTATTKASEASTSATSAASSEADAQDHRDDAQKLATNAEDSQYTLSDGSTTGYSALHYKEKAADSAAAAAASETAAASSATSASSSSTTATTKASEASTSASTATTKASEASSSASSAASAQTAAEAARDSALAALDSFDDRYLGVKSSAPSQDNDGNALVSGALYFDSTSNAMKVYDGSQWLNAYASLSGALIANQNLSDLNNAATARTNLGISTVGATGAFSDLTGTPTTVSGYGITDAFDGAFSSLTGKPTTVSGYGITDAFDGAYSSLTGTPTIPSATSDLTNDSGFITSADGGNAATLDGLDSTQFLRSDANDTFTGTLTTGELQIFSSHPVHTDYSGIANTEAWTTTTQQYLIISAGTDTYINGDSVYIRGGNNSSTNEFRVTTSGSTIGGNTVWHAGNDGSGSGLDADTLDGIQASSFLRSDASDTFTGNSLYFLNTTHWQVSSGDTANQRADARDDGTYFSRLHWYGVRDNGSTSNFRHAWYDGSQYINVTASSSAVNFARTTGSTNLQVAGNNVWHAGNDGSGSGLDADTVDGIQASSFLRSDTSTTILSGATLNFQTSAGGVRGQIVSTETNDAHFILATSGGEDIAFKDGGTGGTTNFLIRGDGNTFTTSNHYIGGNTAWHAGNDGSGSGLDADTLDGYHKTNLQNNTSTSFYVAGQSNRFYKVSINVSQVDGLRVWRPYNATIGGSSSYWNGGSSTHFGALSLDLRILRNDWGGHRSVMVGTCSHNYTVVCARAAMGQSSEHGKVIMYLRGGAGGSGAIYYLTTDSHAATVSVDYNSYLTAADAEFNNSYLNRFINPHGLDHYTLKVSGSQVWHPGNDGSGSGLDADTLDGYHVNSNDRNNEASKIVRTQANGRIYGGQFYANDWFRVEGDQGLYWQGRSRGITSPEQAGNNYGSVTTYNSGRNSWQGWGIQDRFVFMGRSGTDVGVHDNSLSWVWYFHRGNDCMSVKTSTTSSSYSLYVSGQIYATSNITAYSDRRAKENIVTIDNALDKVNALRGVYYNKRFGDDKQREVGVIAQEVQEVVPELVTYAEDVDEYGVKYANTVGLLIEAVKELTAKVEELEEKCQ